MLSRAYAPETLGVPLLVAVVAVVLLVGRIREGLAYGLLLGFGTLTTAGAVSIGALSVKFDLGQSSAAIALCGAGALVVAAGLFGAVRAPRAADASGTPFRWGPASLLAVLGVLFGVAALFVPFGTLEEDGSSASVIQLGDANGLTALALEPIVALAAACLAVYALGKGGAVRLLAAGAALAAGAQTMLFFGTLVGAVTSDPSDFWKPGLDAGPFVGFAAAALILSRGPGGQTPGRRSRCAPRNHDLEREQGDADCDEHCAGQAPAADSLVQEERRPDGGDDDARLADGGHGRRLSSGERGQDEPVRDPHAESGDDRRRLQLRAKRARSLEPRHTSRIAQSQGRSTSARDR